MPTLKLADGITVTYPTPAGGFGWVQGSAKEGGSYHLFIRPVAHGGGVFTDFGEGLVNAETGEPTVHFNNRIWTLTEEKEQIARTQAEDTQ